MTRLFRVLSLSAACLALAAVSACSPGPNPNAKKVVVACLALSAADAGAVVGNPNIIAFKMSGDDAPRSICAYKDDKDNSYGLVQLQKADAIKDPVAELADDEKTTLGVYKSNVKPATTHPADGFGPGAYYANITPRADETSVELNALQDGFMLKVVVHNPKDFATGEQQAVAMAKKISENIKNGTAFKTL